MEGKAIVHGHCHRKAIGKMNDEVAVQAGQNAVLWENIENGGGR